MPIKNLTTKIPQFPRIGKLRKGGEKSPKQPGKDLHYFRFTSETHPEAVKAFNEQYTEPSSLTVLLPYATPDENFDAWMESYKASRLIRRCDGEEISISYNAQRKAYDRPQDMQCMVNCDCKQVGRLQVIIPSLLQAGHVGVVTMETHSKWDISEIYQTLQQYWQMRGSLQGIEFQLYRYKRQISTPENGRQFKWLVGIKPNHEWVIAQLASQSQMALPSGSDAIAMIESGSDIEEEVEDFDFVESGIVDSVTGEVVECEHEVGDEVLVKGDKDEKLGTFKGISDGLYVVSIDGKEWNLKPERVQAVDFLKEELDGSPAQPELIAAEAKALRGGAY